MWHLILHWLGIDNVSGEPYAFWSGSGGILIVWAASITLIWWRTSCQVRRLCLRRGRHDLADPETRVVHKVCWKHAGARRHIGRDRIRQIREAGHLFAGKRPGPG